MPWYKPANYELLKILDAACRQHDVDYLLGRDPLAADQKLLKSVQWHRPDLAPIFVTAMEAKRQFENYFGKHYTSFLYYYPTTFQPSIVFTFAQHSDFDSIKLTSKEAASAFIKVNEIENKWMTLLEEVWLGSCYTLSPSLAEEFKVKKYISICVHQINITYTYIHRYTSILLF